MQSHSFFDLKTPTRDASRRPSNPQAMPARQLLTAIALLLNLGSSACNQTTQSELKLYGGQADNTSFPATIMLRIDLSDGGKSACTGTFIRDDLVLTAAHCAADSIKEIAYGPSMESLKSDNRVRALSWTINPAYQSNGDVLQNTPHDLAVLHFPKGTFTSGVAAISKTAPQAGETIFIVGYGNTQFDPKDIEKVSGIGERKKGTATIGAIAQDVGNAIAWQVVEGDARSAAVLQGDSGGPIYNNNGELIGIISNRGLDSAPDGKWIARNNAANIINGSSMSFVTSQLNGAAPGDQKNPTTLPDNGPSSGTGSVGGYSCEQQAAWGKCGEPWMHPVCDSACGGNSSNPSTNNPGGESSSGSVGGYSCEQQAAWGKCGEPWMHPVCDSACGGNSSNLGTNNPGGESSSGSVGGYSCEQQAAWGKCSEPWMYPVCDSACSGR